MLALSTNFFCDFSTRPSYFRYSEIHLYFETHSEIAEIHVSGIVNRHELIINRKKVV